MGCGTCGTTTAKPVGCRSRGNCLTSCNKLNTFDWLSDILLPEDNYFPYVEVSFNQGSRKEFFLAPEYLDLCTGEMVVVESQFGYDVGQVSLAGEMARLQMRKKKVSETGEFRKVLRRANPHDMERYKKAKAREQKTMLQARVIVRDMKLDMKIGQVEYQADGKKATFYYIADGRVDFRELIKVFAREFRVKIEMRQIGARQEAGKVGGIGSCGRELCCSSWLTQFKSVTTHAARYQQLSINQAKLSGQCGRLKCCLNYELDSYTEAIREFPENADILKTREGEARLLKIDVFKRLMYYAYPEKNRYYKLPVEKVKDILAMNQAGKEPDTLIEAALPQDNGTEDEFKDVVGHITLESLEKNKTRKRKKNNRNRRKKP